MADNLEDNILSLKDIRVTFGQGSNANRAVDGV